MKKIIGIILILCSLTLQSKAQFYYTGVGSAKIKWNQINTEQYRLLFPEEFSIGAQRYSAILDAAYPWVNYNFKVPIRKIPVILRTESQLSNGYVTWAQKREELVTNAPQNTYALSWAKQVAIHEARHVAQMSVLKTGLTKVATWLLGEAGISVGLMVVSKWQLEGDATLAETQFAEYGRGLQPNFTLGYRGLAADGKLNFRTLDRWISGSYRYYVPDIYEYGYQIMSAAETHLSPTIWYDVARFSAKYPILVSPRTIYMKRHYNTTFEKFSRRVFAELDSLWRPTYTIPNSFEVMTAPTKLHTNYGSPLPYGDKIIATKWDMKKPDRFITIDTATMREKLFHSLGHVTSRPIISGDKLFWTEYKPHPIYEQKNFSVVRSYDLKTNRRDVYDRWGVNYFVTPMPDNRFATITNDLQSNSYIRIVDSTFKTDLKSYHFSIPTTIHSLTWDDKTSKLYFIALDDNGMWIGSMDENMTIAEVTAPSVVTVQDLRAEGGKLYFSSIESGKNEIHTIDVATDEQHRQTTSQLGSTSPIAIDSTKILFTAYTPRGWAIARTVTSDSIGVKWSRLPQNTLNPVRYKWKVPLADTMNVAVDSSRLKPVKRFRRALRAPNVHSWAPISLAGSIPLTENSISQLGFGASVLFQSTLSELRGFASYGWVNDMSRFNINAIYSGLPVQMELNAELGGGYQMTYMPTGGVSSIIKEEPLKPFVSVSMKFSVPLNLSSGANSRLLQPSITLSHYNSRYYNQQDRDFSSGVLLYNASLYWGDIRTRGFRSLMPRLGYTCQATVVGAFHNDFSTIFAVNAKGYLPGFAQTHSLSFATTTQYQFEYNDYKLTSKSLVPRGLTNNLAAKNYAALQANYAMPLAYPEWGWDGTIFLRRIWTEFFYDYSVGGYYHKYPQKGLKTLRDYSTGIVINVDNNLLRTLPNTLSFTFANNSASNFWFGFNIAFDL